MTVSWNLMKNGKAVYIDTGAWSSKAIKEAKKYGEVIVAASSRTRTIATSPTAPISTFPTTPTTFICENETIHGVTWQKLPSTRSHILVSDQSSMFLSALQRQRLHGMIYAGVRKERRPCQHGHRHHP